MHASSEDKILAGLIYVLSFFFPILAPLIIWLVKMKTSPFVDFHGREYFNLAISYFVYGLIASILTFILIGWVLIPIIGIALIVLTIIGAVKGFSGETYRFPLIFRLIPDRK
ncbi:DUF4870 domain-containing protein [Alkalicoccus chagannorensis]|uniref:DUF4870 domain-containing protein n=1 Tax=Alkalicoccus chagannorensis TaxID=427072 RepID=UPI0004270427|nr:DUF4870 domain-containing protein [Alkalicoccus chagannorensis]